MSLNAVKILEIFVTTDSKKKILEYLQKYLLQNSKSKARSLNKMIKPLVVVTPNPEQVVYAQKDTHFASILNRADVAAPDGGRLVWASRFLRKLSTNNQRLTIKERIAGVELMEDLVQLAANRGFPVALIGGRGGVAVEALECLRQKYPGLKGWAMEPEEMGIKKIAQKIVQTGTQIVFVGLGAPKQEYFIEKLTIYNLQLTTPLILMSVGGSFDIIAGHIPRAPLIIRSMGFEYIWRLLRQPWRLSRFFSLLKFLWLVVQNRFFFRNSLNSRE